MLETDLIGRLRLSSIPYQSGIVMGATAFMILVIVIVLGSITWYRKWGYLYREWLTTLDHKKIGIMYVIVALVMLLRGFADAVMMRSQQALAFGSARGYLPPQHYDQIFSSHGTIMILFMAMPFLTGLMNVAVPLQIGARDVAFPFMNALSLWLTAISAMLIMISLPIGDFSRAGWSGYPPLSELRYSPTVGVDYWIWALELTGIGSLMTGINFLTTILRMRAPGMTLMRMPMFVWTTACTNILMILAFPVLTIALALLALDRYLGTHFFTAGMGGNLMLYVNLFWMWGHPEVYIVILPAFGVYSEIVPTFAGKPLFGYTSMVYATCAITLISFTVWLHHFFTMGAGPDVNAIFGLATMIIGIPTGVKIFNWLFTMFRGRIVFPTPMLWTLGFIITFTIGGASGVMLALPPANYVLHNSLFVIAHFHNVLIPGTLFGMFAGYTYWFPKALGFRLDERWGVRAFWAWLLGFYFAFMPLYVLGFMGMPRRMEHYTNPAWRPWLEIAAFGVLLILAGIGCQVTQLLVSIRDRAKNIDASGDPWDGRTLEWTVSSPAPVYNFARIPHVHTRDAFSHQKEKGLVHHRPDGFHDIKIPRNTPLAFAVGMLAFGFGFGMVWHIWWLAAITFLLTLVCLIVRGSSDDVEDIVSGAEVERIEKARYRELSAIGADDQSRYAHHQPAHV